MSTARYSRQEKVIAARPSKVPISDSTLRQLMAIEKKIAAADLRAAELRRVRRATVDDGHLYVIEFSTGVIKVGKTIHPKVRLDSHAKSAKVHGISISRSWVSEKHPGHSDTEQELIAFGKHYGKPLLSGKCEYFADLDFEPTRCFAQILGGNRVRAAYLARLVAAVNGDMSATVEQAHAALGEAA